MIDYIMVYWLMILPPSAALPILLFSMMKLKDLSYRLCT